MKKNSSFFVVICLACLSACSSSGNNSTPAFGLNDTGITLCSEDFNTAPGSWTNNITCSLVNWASELWFGEQDALAGRDALFVSGTLIKIGSGMAGFDYTRMGHDGAALAIQNAVWDDLGSENNGTQWECVKDNVTGLWWETKLNDPTQLRHKDHTYTWFSPNAATNGGDAGTEANAGTCTGVADTTKCNTLSYAAAVNQSNLCGHSDWRLPTIEEFMTLSNKGQTVVAIDTNHFPNTLSTSANWNWASNSDAICQTCAWTMRFAYGDDNIDQKNSTYLIRLVRGTNIHN